MIGVASIGGGVDGSVVVKVVVGVVQPGLWEQESCCCRCRCRRKGGCKSGPGAMILLSNDTVQHGTKWENAERRWGLPLDAKLKRRHKRTTTTPRRLDNGEWCWAYVDDQKNEGARCFADWLAPSLLRA